MGVRRTDTHTDSKPATCVGARSANAFLLSPALCGLHAFLVGFTRKGINNCVHRSGAASIQKNPSHDFGAS